MGTQSKRSQPPDGGCSEVRGQPGAAAAQIKGAVVAKLRRQSTEVRRTILEMLYRIGPECKGHPGGALSIVELVTCLYFHVMRIDPTRPQWPERDRFILSKGHACPAVYAALALRGYFDRAHLNTFRHVGSLLQGHPDVSKTPGIDMTTGSLGHGLAAGVGMALAAKMDRRSYMTYVILGDGELQEGLVWEALLAGGHYRLDNLVAIIDRNRWQGCDSVARTMEIEPVSNKIASFNWDVLEIDGHSVEEVLEALRAPHPGVPRAIIARTVKGRGVSFMEDDNTWHQRTISREDYCRAMTELALEDGDADP